jgi:hypothetical protein
MLNRSLHHEGIQKKACDSISKENIFCSNQLER